MARIEGSSSAPPAHSARRRRAGVLAGSAPELLKGWRGEGEGSLRSPPHRKAAEAPPRGRCASPPLGPALGGVGTGGQGPLLGASPFPPPPKQSVRARAVAAPRFMRGKRAHRDDPPRAPPPPPDAGKRCPTVPRHTRGVQAGACFARGPFTFLVTPRQARLERRHGGRGKTDPRKRFSGCLAQDPVTAFNHTKLS